MKTSPEKKSDYMEIRIPRFSFHDASANGFLVITLIVFAFFLGMLTNKVLYLESSAKTANANSAVNAQAVNAPTQPPPPERVDNLEVGKLPLLGNKDAKVTVVEFSDFQCPFCKSYFDDTHKQLVDKYITTGKIKFYFRHFPLNSIHPNAQKAGEAAECANEQNKFWDYHDLLFENQAAWSALTGTDVTNSFTEQARQLGLDTDQFRSCLDTDKYKSRVDEDTAAGQKVQVDGTPTFFINGYRLVGAQPFSAIQKAIEDELKK